MRVRTPDAAVAPLKPIEPVEVPVRPRVKAPVPCIATVPVKEDELEIV